MMNPLRRGRIPLLPMAFAALAMLSGQARSDGGHRYALGAIYKEECGSCHTPYPPQLLPDRSWTSIMAGLDRHFGSDASLDPAKAKEIQKYLTANADRKERWDGAGAPLRITETSWFKRKHRDGHDGLTASIWKSPPVKSPANCGACHRRASEGDYGEDDIRLPGTN